MRLTVLRDVDDHGLVVELLDVARMQVLLETEELLSRIERCSSDSKSTASVGDNAAEK